MHNVGRSWFPPHNDILGNHQCTTSVMPTDFVLSSDASPSPGGQKHHHLGSTAIHPHWEPWECLTVERVCWISYRDFTTHSVKKWGFSLGLILPARMGLKAAILGQFGWL